MSKLIKLAWRSVWRNRRRSIITMSAIGFAILLTTITRSLQFGMYDAVESHAIRSFNGDFHVQHPQFQKDRTLNRSIEANAADWEQWIVSHPNLIAFTQRITSGGLISTESPDGRQSSYAIMVIGVNPVRETEVTEFMEVEKVTKGQPLQVGLNNEILIGHRLAKNMKASVGDEVVILSQGYRNEMAVDLYRIRGILTSGAVEIDKSGVVMSLADAQELFSMQNRVTQVVFRTTDFRQTDDIVQRIEPEDKLKILPWQTLIPDIEQMIALDNVGGAIMLVFIMVIVGFEIFNTTMMGILERRRELGVLQAIGMKPGQVTIMLLVESIMKICLALLISVLISALLLHFIADKPFSMGEEYDEVMRSTFGYEASMVFSPDLKVYAEPLIWITIISTLSLIYPIYVVSQLKPIAAVHNT